MIAFPAALPGLSKTQIDQVDQYAKFGYGAWTYGAPLPVATRADLLPAGAAPRTTGKKAKLLRFFAFTDVHITDKEAPNQLIAFQQTEPFAVNNTSIYSPVMLVHDAGAGRRDPDRQRPAQERSLRLRRDARRRQQQPHPHRVALVHRRVRRQADHAEFGRARRRATRSTTRSRSRPPGSTAPSPGIRSSAITITSISARSRSTTAIRAFARPMSRGRCGRSATRSFPRWRISRSCSTSPPSRPSRPSTPA